jgi:hypothetical protein
MADAERAAYFAGGRVSPAVQYGQFPVGHEPARRERADQHICDQPEPQHPGQDIHGEIVDLVARQAGGDLRFAQVIDDDGSDDPGGGLGGQQPPMDGADKLRPEDICEIGRDRRETAAIHRHDDREGADKEHLAAEMCAPRRYRDRRRYLRMTTQLSAISSVRCTWATGLTIAKLRLSLSIRGTPYTSGVESG